MGAYLSWDKAASVEYTAGQALALALEFEAPEDGTYYLVGALYNTTTGVIVAGTSFNVVVPTGATIAVNSSDDPTEYAMLAAASEEIDCQFTLSLSDVSLSVFAMKMIGASPSAADDITIDSLTTVLTSPAAEVGFDLDINSIMEMMIMVAIVVMMMKMMAGVTKS